VVLTYPDRELELRKDDQGWRLVRPAEAPADDTVVKGLLSTLTDAEVQKTLGELPPNLADFGLDKPTVTVKLTLKDGSQPPPLVVGKNTAIGGKAYVRKDDEPKLYLTTSALGYGLNKQAKDVRDKAILAFKDEDASRFRDKTVLGFDPTRVGKLTLERKDGGAVRFARADGKWSLESGEGKKAPKDSAIATLLDDLRDLRGADIAAEPAKDLAAWGLDHPDLRITLTDKEGQPIGTVLGAKHDGKSYVTRAGSETVFEARDYMYARLDKPPKDLGQ